MPTAEAEAPEAPVRDPYDPPTQEERDRLAAEVERRRATGAQEPASGRGLEPSEEFRARIAKLAASLPQPPDDAEEPWDDPLELRVRRFREAFRENLAAAGEDDLGGWTLDRLAGDQHPGALRRFVDSIGEQAPVKTLTLAGRIGPGKTSAAIAAGNAAVERGLLVRFVKHQTYLSLLRPQGRPDDLPEWKVRRLFRECDLLILDDLAAEQDESREFVRKETLGLLDDRVNAVGRFTILTTNESSAALDAIVGERLVSRLSRRGHVLKFTGPERYRRLSW